LGYGLGYFGGRAAIERMAGFIGFGWPEVEAMQKRLTGRRMGWALAGLRALPVVPLSLISMAAGVVRWPVGPFSLWTFAGSVPRCLLLGYLGWLTRDAYEALAHRLNFLESAVSALLVAGVVVLVLWLRSQLKRA
jgi:uncharacterized membrane protein YdjX (TVP38/TMEM64 family)